MKWLKSEVWAVVHKGIITGTGSRARRTHC